VARNASVEVFFHAEDNNQPDVEMANELAGKHTEIDIAMYALNRQGIVDAIQNAYSACECVRLISDATQASSDPKQTTALAQLQAAGVPIKVDSHSGLMHMKVVEIDQVELLAGSFNATNAASTTNDEIMLRIRSAQTAQAFAAEYNKMWNDSRRFKNWQAPPGTVTPVPALGNF
jgi:phosphatidylserine/phosphatidylglycerophosphate/cardiolipin synthase-like enzyme